MLNDWEVPEEKEILCDHYNTRTVEVLKTDFDTGAQYLDVITRCNDCGVRV